MNWGSPILKGWGGWFEVSEGRYNISDAAPSLQTRDGEKDKSINLGRMKRDEQSYMTLAVRQRNVSRPNPPWARKGKQRQNYDKQLNSVHSLCALLRHVSASIYIYMIIFRHSLLNYKENILKYNITCFKWNKIYSLRLFPQSFLWILLTHSLTHSLSFPYSLTHSLTYLLTHSLIPLLTHLLT